MRGIYDSRSPLRIRLFDFHANVALVLLVFLLRPMTRLLRTHFMRQKIAHVTFYIPVKMFKSLLNTQAGYGTIFSLVHGFTPERSPD